MSAPEISVAADERVMPGGRFWEGRLLFRSVAEFCWKLMPTRQYDLERQALLGMQAAIRECRGIKL